MFLDALFTDLIGFLTDPLSLYLKASKLATFIFYVKDVYLHMIEEKREEESNCRDIYTYLPEYLRTRIKSVDLFHSLMSCKLSCLQVGAYKLTAHDTLYIPIYTQESLLKPYDLYSTL